MQDRRRALQPQMASAAAAALQGSDHALRYLSLHDNQYVRYFKGHSARVTALAMSPKNDLFMSAAEVRGCAQSGLCVDHTLSDVGQSMLSHAGEAVG